MRHSEISLLELVHGSLRRRDDSICSFLVLGELLRRHG